MIDPKLLTTKQASLYLNVSESFIVRDRLGIAPSIPFVKLAANIVRYRQSDLDKYIQSNIK